MLLNIGGWKVYLESCTPDTISSVRKVIGFFSPEIPTYNIESQPDQNTYFIAVASPAVLQNASVPGWLPDSLQIDWKKFQNDLSKYHQHFSQPDQMSVPCFSWPITGFEYRTSRSLADIDNVPRFSALVINKPSVGSYVQILLFTIMLATIWHIDQGGLCLHSSVVNHQNDGYLFLGKSESGKTTIAQLSSTIRDHVLGDDINILFPDGDGYAMAAMPSSKSSPLGYSSLRPPLRGIFKIIQDDRDYLVRMTPMQTVKLLYEGLLQIPKSTAIPKNKLSIAFHTMSKIARQIPGYKLHFRKSPDFWKVIEMEFPPYR